MSSVFDLAETHGVYFPADMITCDDYKQHSKRSETVKLVTTSLKQLALYLATAPVSAIPALLKSAKFYVDLHKDDEAYEFLCAYFRAKFGIYSV